MDQLDTRDIQRTLTGPAREERPRGRHYALIVGVDRYRGSLSSLRYAVSDAQVLSKRLTKEFGFQVELMTNEAARAAAIRGVLERWARETEPQDSVLVFFAGHGQSRQRADGELEGYLVPAGATDDPTTWLPASEIVRLVQALPARWVFLIFDACYAGAAFRRDIATADREDQVLRALMAGTKRQPVLDGGAGDHSVFTRAVLDGLDGWADSGTLTDDVITAEELIVFVKHEVPWRSRVRAHRQTPEGGLLQVHREKEDFEFRPTTDRLPAPLLRNIESRKAEDRVAAAQQLGDRASSDSSEVIRKKAEELTKLLQDDDVLEVRVTAAEALGRLGHKDAPAPLIDLLGADGRAPSALRAAAASALGELAQHDAFRADAVEALIAALRIDDEEVVEAAKLALGGVPAAGQPLQDALKEADRPQQRQLLDALACLAQRHPKTDAAWPPGDIRRRWLLHRVFLARRRLRPQWQAIWRRGLALGISGALGLTLAYLMVIFRAKQAAVYRPALLTYNLLPGALGGVSLALVPRLITALARRQGGLTRALGGAIAGLIFGLGLYLPNQFVRVGDTPLAFLLPGLISGPLLGLAFTWPPWAPAAASGRQGTPRPADRSLSRWLLWLATLIVGGALGFAVVRIPKALAWGHEEVHAVEVLKWAVGGAIMGTSLAAGWSMSEPQHHAAAGD